MKHAECYLSVITTHAIPFTVSKQQELIRRGDSERELSRSVPGNHPNSLK